MHRRLSVITMRQNSIFENLKRHNFYTRRKQSSRSNRVFHKIVMADKIQQLLTYLFFRPLWVVGGGGYKKFCPEEFMK